LSLWLINKHVVTTYEEIRVQLKAFLNSRVQLRALDVMTFRIAPALIAKKAAGLYRG
jgi:hypothetical protein